MPDPLDMPPSVTVLPESSSETAACLLWVSVVIMAREAASPASSVSAFADASSAMPFFTRSIGICIPITPVDPIRTERSGMPRTRPASFAVSSQIFRPSRPVQALAIPEFTTTACTFSRLSRTMLRSHRTGAAFTTFEVKVPAATQGTLLYTSAMSVRPSYLIPAAAAAA